jgi:hypothetical protein
MNRPGSARSHLTLALCTILHGFTHAYGSMLVPLYFRIAEDLKLSGVGAATLIVTLYGAVYNLASYAAGLAADRFSRKTLLAVGLARQRRRHPRDWIVPAILPHPDARRRRRTFRTIFHPSPTRWPARIIPNRRGWRSAFWVSVRDWAFSSARKSPAGAPRRLPGNSGTSPNGKSPASKWPSRDSLSESSSCSRHRCRRRAARRSAKIDPALNRRIDANGVRPDVPRFRRCRRPFPGRHLCPQVFNLKVSQAGLFVGIMMLPSVIFNPLAVYLTPKAADCRD